MFHKKKIYYISNNNVNSLENIIPDSSSNTPESSVLKERNTRSLLKPFLGLFYTFLTSVFITLSSVFVKKLTYISPGELSLVRNAGVFAGSLPVAFYCVKEVLGSRGDRLSLIGRGFLTATALYLNLTAFRYLPLAEAAVIMSTLPAVVTIIARIYLKELCGIAQSFCILVTICGVLLSIRLPELLSKRSTTQMNSYYIGGLSCAVGCVLLLSVSLVALRKMKHVHFSVMLIYTGFIGVTENALINFLISFYEVPNCGWDPYFVMLIGIFGFIGHCTLTLAIQMEEVGIVSVMKASMDIVVAMVFQIVFFKDKLDVYNISGACLVIASVSVIGFRKWILNLPEASGIKRKLKYLLL